MGGAAVEYGKQGRRFFAGKGLRDFEIAARGGVHADILAVGFERNAVEVLRHQVLRQADVVQQRARRTDGCFVFLAVQTEAVQVLAAEVFGQQFRARVGGKLPRVQARDVGRGRLKIIRQAFAFGQQDFRRLQTRQLVGEFVRCRQLGFEFAALQRCPCDGNVFLVCVHRHNAVGFFVF